jgi:hypothetical protein
MKTLLILVINLLVKGDSVKFTRLSEKEVKVAEKIK